MERILAYFGSYKFIFSVCIVAAALVCWLLLRHLIHRFTEKITAASALSGRRQTYLALALNSVRGLLALLALILVLQVHGVNVSSLIAGLGIIGAIVGLALQDMLKDVIMGTNILTGEYFAVGDVIKYGDLIGEVVQFSLRSTKIRELATNNIVTVSNRNIFEATRVSNELFITVPTSYADDPNTIEPFLQQLAREISALPDVESCDFLGLSNLGEYSVDYLWGLRAKPAVQSAVRRRALGHIRHRFAENVLLLGRVVDGAGGECLVNACRAELAKTGEGMEIFLPEESFRRVGQAAAAAMLEAAAE